MSCNAGRRGIAEGSLDAPTFETRPVPWRNPVYWRHDTREYRKSIEKDRSLEARFQAVKVEPEREEAVRIRAGCEVPPIEKFHMVNYTDEAIESARVSLQSVYPRPLPAG